MKKEQKKWIGKRVQIIIDRPIGSRHPVFPETEYKLNYGYVPNTVADDGDPIDAYILGIEKSINNFDGIVIALVEREDDNEFKLIVAQSDQYSENDIKKQIYFQEKYFKSKIVK